MRLPKLTALATLLSASAVATPITMTVDQYDALLQAARTKANNAYNTFNADRGDYHKADAWVDAGNEVTRIQNMDVIFAPPPVTPTPVAQPKAPIMSPQAMPAAIPTATPPTPLVQVVTHTPPPPKQLQPAPLAILTPVTQYAVPKPPTMSVPPTPIMQTALTPAQKTPQPLSQAVPPRNGVDGKDGKDGKDGVTTVQNVHSYIVDTATTSQVKTNSTSISQNGAAIAHSYDAIQQNSQQISKNSRDIDQNRQKIKKVGAMAQAIAGLHYDANNSGLAVAAGEYDGASSVAGGAQFQTTHRSAATVGVSWDGDAVGANVGWHMSF